MLSRWTLENFKPIREQLDLPTAPLTVLAGLNSSGKSSLLQSILLVAQTLANQKLDEPLVLNGTLVRVGTFHDICNDRAKEQQIRIGFTLRAPTNGYVLLPSRNLRTGWAHAAQAVSISMDVQFEGVAHEVEEGRGLQAVRAALNRIDVEIISPEPLKGGEAAPLNIAVRRATPDDESEFTSGVRESYLSNLPYPPGQNYIAKVTTSEPDPGDHFNGESLVQLAHIVPRRYFRRYPQGNGIQALIESASSPVKLRADQAAQYIIDTFSGSIRYLGPLRAEPQAIQSYSPSGQPDDVGPRGEYAAAVYASNRKQPIRWWNPESQQVETATLEDATDAWLRYLGIADHVSTREAAMPGVSWMVRSGPKMRERPLQAVGVGVSQVLPILVAGLLAPEGAILIMEQPELHLHERPQARLGDFFYGLTRADKQVFIETHSAVLINQLRFLMVTRGDEAREAISVYFVEQDEQGDAKFEPIRISKGGAIVNWPDGFFDESFRQEVRITQEGIRARARRANA
jgi:predicted ATPase